MQEGKPVAYASKSLTPTETNYAQIEKEMYAAVFGCTKFHQYIYGRKVTVETDHKPLIPISKKPLHAAPPRLQRMLIQLQKYDVELICIPGKQIPVADTLSRNFMPDTYKDLANGIEAHVHTVVSNAPVSDRKIKKIQEATQSDPQFQVLKNTILMGWPESRKDCPPTIIEYWNYRDELSVTNDLILKGEKIVVPNSLRQEILETLHTGHMGIEKCLKRARAAIFWPKLATDVSKYISNCSVCLKYHYSNPKETLEPHPVPSRPWQVVGTDLFEWENKIFIVVVDFYSHFFEVAQLHSSTSSAIIRKLKPIFARFGIQEQVLSDNGPQFSSQEFEECARQYDFNHTTSSPHYPQSNGMAEKYVQIVKRIFKKTKLDCRDPLLGILEYRTTPLEAGYSPAQLLQGRQLRTTLPTLPRQLEPKPINHTEAKLKLERAKQLEKRNYDKGSRPLPPVKVGQNVHIQNNDNSWKPGVVIGEAGPRSFIVSSQGGVYRRNRRHILHKAGKAQLIEQTDLNLLQDVQITSTNQCNTHKEHTTSPTPNITPSAKPTPKKPDKTAPMSAASSQPTIAQPSTTSKPYITHSG